MKGFIFAAFVIALLVSPGGRAHSGPQSSSSTGTGGGGPVSTGGSGGGWTGGGHYGGGNAAPEPLTLGGLALAGAGLAWARRKRKR